MSFPTPIPSPNQLAWQRTETNLFIHFGLNTFSGREWGDGTDSPSLFNPTNLDCAQWAQVAHSGGFQIAILTAKHHDGFCLWPSRYTNYSIKSAPWKKGCGDVVQEFVDGFRAVGIKVGLYLSPWDRHESSYGSDDYNNYYCHQLTELLTQYGELHEVWFDGACGEGPNGKVQVYDWPRYFDLVKKLQPTAVTFGDGGTDVRWVGNERGIAGETCWATINPELPRFPGDSGIAQPNDARASMDIETLLNEGSAPDGSTPTVWRPAECDVSIRPGLFYHKEEDEKVRSADAIMDIYFQSVGRNGTLLLNIPATTDGLLSTVDAASVAGFRENLNQLFSQNLASTAEIVATAETPYHEAKLVLSDDPNTFWAAPTEQGKCALELTFPNPIQTGMVVLCEPIQQGQRIAQYYLEVETSIDDWKIVATGTSIGYKRIHRFAPIITQRIRLSIIRTHALPAISTIAVYGVLPEAI